MLPTAFLRRAAGTARAAASVGKAGALRLVRHNTGDDEVLGQSLFQELDRLKGMAMKVGQILSYMEVGLPEATVARLALLQRGVTPLDFGPLSEVLQDELGAPVLALFDAFDRTPIAAASIGQVHRATLRGTPVAVKIRYPGIVTTLESDARQLRVIARLAALATAVDGLAIVTELRERLLEECDYEIEAKHQRTFGHLFEGDADIIIPRVFDDRSTSGVLTTGWQDGGPLNDLATAAADRRNIVARTLVRFFFDSLGKHHVIHADPHPGNFLVTDAGRLVVLDFGCVKAFEAGEVKAFADLCRAVVGGQRSEVLARAVAAGLVLNPERIDQDELWDMMCWMFAPYRTPTFTFDRAYWDQMQRFNGIASKNGRHLAMPPAWLWLQRSLLGLHAVLMRLGVSAPMADLAAPLLD